MCVCLERWEEVTVLTFNGWLVVNLFSPLRAKVAPQRLVIFQNGFWGDQSSLSLNLFNFEQYCIFKMVEHDDIAMTSCLL